MADLLKLRPLNDRVLVKRIEQEERTASGLYIPEVAKEKAQVGEVVSVGPGARDAAGNRLPVAVKAGDTVYFGKFAGTETGADDYLIVREDEILGVVEQ